MIRRLACAYPRSLVYAAFVIALVFVNSGIVGR